MKKLIKSFPYQIRESLNIASNHTIKIDRTITNVILCGMGGSGIGLELIRSWSFNQMNLPLDVIHGYNLPAYLSRNSLVILSSYSGNTEETISCAEEAREAGALLLGITSGGKLEQILNDNKAHCIKIPGGLPPRAALGYSLVQLAGIFQQLEFAQSELIANVKKSSLFLEQEQNAIIEQAKKINANSAGKHFVFYSEDRLSAVLLRACQQLNENSKELAHYNVIPEMNHNEIVGWRSENKKLCFLIVRSKFESTQNSKRLDIMQNILSKKGQSTQTIVAEGENIIEEAFYLIHLFDWLSYFRSEENNVDIMEVDIIDSLKQELNR